MADESKLCVKFVCILLCVSTVCCRVIVVQYYGTTDRYAILKEGASVDWYTAWANFTDDTNSTGWSSLTVKTNGSFASDVQATAAGIAEGYLTKTITSLFWRNTMAGYCDPAKMSDYCHRLVAFLQKNFAWMQEKIKANPDDPFWYQVGLYLRQLSGINQGSNFYMSTTSVAASPHVNLSDIQPGTSMFQFIMFQIGGDLEDLEVALHKEDRKHVLGSGSCSALVKLLPQNADLYFSQDTWNTYQSMLRILKHYDFPFTTPVYDDKKMSTVSRTVPGSSMSFSSSPGVLYSGDDFYLINSGLASMETTNGNSNPALYEKVTAESVLEGLRTMVANRLATSGKTWAQIFSMYNSGTYNNQWMVVDYNKFTPGQPVLPNTGLLYVLEQLPGFVEYDDMTHVLNQTSYWASYNLPAFPTVYKMSGVDKMAAKYGAWFTHDHNPRANIFRRDNGKVTDEPSMMKLMRYNNFTHDPLSKCNCTPPYSAENAISARCDLNPANGSYPFGALGHRQHGGTDMKFTTYKMSQSLNFYAVAGPTYDPEGKGLQPFDWSKSDFEKTVPHFGQPTKFNFTTIVTNWT